MSRLRIALLCLDASSFGKQPLRAGDAASAASEAWPQAGRPPLGIKLRPVTMALSRERVLHIVPIFLNQLATRSAFSFLLTQQLG